MSPTLLTLPQLRRVIQNTWEETVGWMLAKPRVFGVPHPEQQIQFEVAYRLRETLRSLSANPQWDRLYFDGSASSLSTQSIAEMVGRRAPIYLDTRQLFGLQSRRERSSKAPDFAIAVHVLRSCDEILDLDDNARPRHQSWMPISMRAQGWVLEQHVRHFEQLSEGPCDAFLFVVYSNEARRHTLVDKREVASWASWRQASDILWWASRHFRTKAT